MSHFFQRGHAAMRLARKRRDAATSASRRVAGPLPATALPTFG